MLIFHTQTILIGNTKVKELYTAITIECNIGGIDVTMGYSDLRRMQVLNGEKKLIDDRPSYVRKWRE